MTDFIYLADNININSLKDKNCVYSTDIIVCNPVFVFNHDRNKRINNQIFMKDLHALNSNAFDKFDKISKSFRLPEFLFKELNAANDYFPNLKFSFLSKTVKFVVHQLSKTNQFNLADFSIYSQTVIFYEFNDPIIKLDKSYLGFIFLDPLYSRRIL